MGSMDTCQRAIDYDLLFCSAFIGCLLMTLIIIIAYVGKIKSDSSLRVQSLNFWCDQFDEQIPFE